jgi:Na+-transporting methylmalonyl-CoA/oxaloacetate decarboxylase gamma subunit
MTEEMGEGLYLAAVGMGVVFFTLVVFMLILFALGKLFPGEEVPEDIETDEAPGEVGVIMEEQQVRPQPVVANIQEPSATGAAASAGSIAAGSIAGSRIAAMAVAMYLAMEQEERAANALVSSTTVGTAQSRGEWTARGRDSLKQSQGQRPQAYGQKTHSAYSQKPGLRE